MLKNIAVEPSTILEAGGHQSERFSVQLWKRGRLAVSHKRHTFYFFVLNLCFSS